MTYIDLMLAWDMMAGLGGLKISHLSTIRLFLEDGAETASCAFCLLLLLLQLLRRPAKPSAVVPSLKHIPKPVDLLV